MKLDVPNDYVALLITAWSTTTPIPEPCCEMTSDTSKPRIGSSGNEHRSWTSRYGR
jgi:hypothetical protein